MGLCTSKSAVALVPSAKVPNAEATCRASGQGSPRASPTWDHSVLMVQPFKPESGGVRSSSQNPTAKGYLELGDDGGGEGEEKKHGEADEEEEGEEEEEEDTEGGEIEELLNFSESEGSLMNEFLD